MQIQDFKLDSVYFTLAIGLIDQDDADLLGIDQDQLSSVQVLENTVQAHGNGLKVSSSQAYITFCLTSFNCLLFPPLVLSQ
jgi:hypothetical protein